MLEWLNEIDDTGYRVSLSILWDGHVQATTYAMGIADDVPEVEASHRSACFSATRLDKLAQLIKTRSLYGVGFSQDVVAAAGGRSVQYLDSCGTDATALRKRIEAQRRAGVKAGDPLWTKTPFIDGSRANAWEEEWRVPGGFRFEPDDVAFVFLPEDLHDNARTFFEEHRQAHTGPAYRCRYIDPRWDAARIKKTLAEPVPAPPASQPVVPSPASPFARGARS